MTTLPTSFRPLRGLGEAPGAGCDKQSIDDFIAFARRMRPDMAWAFDNIDHNRLLTPGSWTCLELMDAISRALGFDSYALFLRDNPGFNPSRPTGGWYGSGVPVNRSPVPILGESDAGPLPVAVTATPAAVEPGTWQAPPPAPPVLTAPATPPAPPTGTGGAGGPGTIVGIDPTKPWVPMPLQGGGGGGGGGGGSVAETTKTESPTGGFPWGKVLAVALVLLNR